MTPYNQPTIEYMTKPFVAVPGYYIYEGSNRVSSSGWYGTRALAEAAIKEGKKS